MNSKYTLAVLLLFTLILTSATTSLGAKKAQRTKTEKTDRRSRAVSNVQRPLSLKRQRALELQRQQARRRAEAARLAAIARQRAIDNAMRADVQALISRDNTTGEDPEVRRVALNALGEHAGTVVVMDPNSGRVYAIVNQEWALRRGFKPCSTIKLVTGLAGLNEQVIDPTNTVNISDSNRINLTNALAYSNNTYFQEVGGQVGFSKMISYARRLGLGEKTGINGVSESAGQLPNMKTGYAVNHMSSHGDDFKVTAIQLATLVSAMANGGKLISPRILRTPQELAKFKPGIRRNINMDLDLLRYMVPGMVGAVNYGSGRRAKDPQATVAGKTGTCIENGTWVGLFTSYAPLANPRLAVVVIARGADAHSHFPAAVAGRIYRELNGRFGTPTDLQIAAKRPAANELNSLDEEDVESEDEQEENEQVTRPTSASAGRLETSVSAAQATPQPLLRNSTPSNVRRVLMPIPRKIEPTNSKPLPKPLEQQQTRPRRVNPVVN
ncbi:MAG TPA: penicillin-binding transpeptidase domain-containing protein [Pyrinomonadaceae bacterium]|nr:penicillin-binding transpeptidase domain-containing protein [Pyrinomonadaceae bacterium]